LFRKINNNSNENIYIVFISLLFSEISLVYSCAARKKTNIKLKTKILLLS